MSDEVNLCESCNTAKHTKTMMVNGKYYKRICGRCVAGLQGDETFSSNAASYERRRTYEDNAQDTIQPYDANGKPRAEFYRLYPDAAQKTFTPAEIAEVRRKM